MADRRKTLSGFEKLKLRRKRELAQAAASPKQMKLSFPSTQTAGSSSETPTREAVETEQPADASEDLMRSDEERVDSVEMSGRIAVVPDLQQGTSDGATQEESGTATQNTNAREQLAGSATVILFKSDKSLYKTSEEFSAHKEYLLHSEACQPRETDMPENKFPVGTSASDSQRRHFTSDYYYRNNSLNERVQVPWVAYSYRENFVYCHHCWLFGNEKMKRTAMVSGCNDWQHLSQVLRRHEASDDHMESIISFVNYQSGKGIEHVMHTALTQQVRDWQEVVRIQFQVLQKLTACGLPIRGHRDTVSLQEEEGDGVYFTLIKFIANTLSPALQRHILSSNRLKYFSHRIIDEEVAVLAQLTRQKLIDRIREAKFFSILADGSTDIAHHDQLSLVARYVNLDAENVAITESFLGFVCLSEGTAQAITDAIWNTLTNWHLDPYCIRGQGYDGASVMSGKSGGVQKLLKDRLGSDSYAPYVHCSAHSTNLVLVHAAEKNAAVQVITFFGTIEELYVFFSDSNRRWYMLEKTIKAMKDVAEEEKVDEPERENEGSGNDDAVKDQRHSKKPLKRLCPTRWSSRRDAVTTLRDNFSKVVDCLEQLVQNRHNSAEVSRADCFLKALNFDFYVMLVFWSNVLDSVHFLSNHLQKIATSLAAAHDHMQSTAELLEVTRTDEAFDSMIQSCKANFIGMGFLQEDAEFRQARHRRAKTHFGETCDSSTRQTPYETFRVDVYFRSLDEICAELRERAAGLEEIDVVFGKLDSKILPALSQSSLKEWSNTLQERFPKEFTDRLFAELLGFRSIFFSGSRQAEVPKASVAAYLEFILKGNLRGVFPEVEILCRLYLTIPVSTATNERAFSTMRRIKSYLRSVLDDARLSDLALLSIERRTASSVNLEQVIAEFGARKSRRAPISTKSSK